MSDDKNKETLQEVDEFLQSGVVLVRHPENNEIVGIISQKYIFRMQEIGKAFFPDSVSVLID